MWSLLGVAHGGIAAYITAEERHVDGEGDAAVVLAGDVVVVEVGFITGGNGGGAGAEAEAGVVVVVVGGAGEGGGGLWVATGGICSGQRKGLDQWGRGMEAVVDHGSVVRVEVQCSPNCI